MLNAANPANGFVSKWSPFASRYLDNDGRWFFLASEHENYLKWKEQPKQTSENDFDTDNIKFKSKMRFGVWPKEWRGTYCNITSNPRS